MKNAAIPTFVVALVVAAGCETTHRRGGGDEDDGGGIMLLGDAGGIRDDGGSTEDAMSAGDAGTHQSRDAGRDEGDDAGGGGGTCTPMTVEPPPGGACSPTTSDCIRNAGTQAQLNDCLAGAATECRACINDQVLSCATSRDCDLEYGCVLECAMTNGCTETPCVERHCSGELDDLQGCVGDSGCTISDLCLQ